MARVKKTTLFGSVEGIRDKLFLDALVEIYDPRSNNINPTFKAPIGAEPDTIVGHALRECHRDRSFAWFDEDFDPSKTLSREVRAAVATKWNLSDPPADFFTCATSNLQTRYNPKKRNPILIVSSPVCVDGLIIQTLGRTPCHPQYEPAFRNRQIQDLKRQLESYIGESDEMDFYRGALSKTLLEQRRETLAVLDMLIRMII